jgi:glucosamine--fructose-6-phosphate aminotransferase (isomerizing)
MSKSYHMIDYIHEGPDGLRRTLAASEAGIEYLVGRIRRDGIERIILTGVGSSYTAAMMAQPAFWYHCPLPVYVMPGPELGYYGASLVGERTLVIAISRSGERGVVVNTLAESIAEGALGVAVTAVPDSLMAQKAELALASAEGGEITWPKTKSVIAATGLLMRLALALAPPEDEAAVERLRWLLDAPGSIERTIEAVEPQLCALMPTVEKQELVAVVGTGPNYGTAIEGAMKVMEASSVSTRFDSTDGLLNGPVGGLDARWLVVALVTPVDLEQTRELLGVVRSLGARSLCICAPGLDLGTAASHVLNLPESPDALLGPLLYLPPLQLLAYFWTVARGMNPDAPQSMRAILDAILPPGREEPE